MWQVKGNDNWWRFMTWPSSPGFQTLRYLYYWSFNQHPLFLFLHPQCSYWHLIIDGFPASVAYLCICTNIWISSSSCSSLTSGRATWQDAGLWQLGAIQQQLKKGLSLWNHTDRMCFNRVLGNGLSSGQMASRLQTSLLKSRRIWRENLVVFNSRARRRLQYQTMLYSVIWGNLVGSRERGCWNHILLLWINFITI